MKGSGYPSVARWIKFNLVGAIGIGVQLGILALLMGIFHMNYMPATGLAVETTVLHNFVWHERFTWANRGAGGWRDVCMRLLRFNVTAGTVSIGGNLLLMRLLVGEAGVTAFAANLVSIAVCSLLNFVVSDQWVFSASQRSAGLQPAVGITRKNRSYRQSLISVFGWGRFAPGLRVRRWLRWYPRRRLRGCRSRRGFQPYGCPGKNALRRNRDATCRW
jgi:putative flippase GtrA